MIVKCRVAVLLVDPARAAQLASLLDQQGASADVSVSSDDFCRALNRSPIDVIVIEQKLGGFLAGLEIIERLFDDLLRPATILLGELSEDEAQRAHAIGVQCVLPSDAAADEIADQLRRLAGEIHPSEVVISATARRIVRRAEYIRPLPQLLLKLVGHLRNDEIDASSLVRDVSSDPLIAADLLKYANSSAVGRKQKTLKLSEAVSYLGPRKAIGIAVSTGMQRARVTLVGELPPLVHHWHSCRAVLTASTAAAFASDIEKISEGTAYLLGLIQDVGILIMARAFGDPYIEILERVQRIAQLSLPDVEQDGFGVSHAEVSAALLRKWEFPSLFVSLVLRHHDRDVRNSGMMDHRFLRAMQIGEAFSNLHDNRAPQRYLALRNLLDFYGGEAQLDCRSCLAQAVAHTVEAGEVMNSPAPSESELQAILREMTRWSDDDTLAVAPPDAQQHAEPAADQPFQMPSAPVAGGVNVLVIDDEPLIIDTIRLFLRDSDYRVASCESLADGRRLAPQVDVVLCDVHLGDESGIDLVRELRESLFAGPIIMISGDGHRATVLGSIEAGVNDYLIKPFSKSQLLEKLRKPLRPVRGSQE